MSSTPSSRADSASSLRSPGDDPEDLGVRAGQHPHGEAHGDPVLDEVETHVDPAVAEAVHSVRDRFGSAGLRDLITLATYELDLAEQALASLRAEVVDAPPSPEDAAFDSPLASDPDDRDQDLLGTTDLGTAGTGR